MTLAPPSRADLDSPAATDDHQYHFYTAFRTFPVVRYVIPLRAWCDALVRKARRLVIDKAAYDAFPLFHSLTSRSWSWHPSFQDAIVTRGAWNKAMKRTENFHKGLAVGAGATSSA